MNKFKHMRHILSKAIDEFEMIVLLPTIYHTILHVDYIPDLHLNTYESKALSKDVMVSETMLQILTLKVDVYCVI